MMPSEREFLNKTVLRYLKNLNFRNTLENMITVGLALLGIAALLVSFLIVNFDSKNDKKDTE